MIDQIKQAESGGETGTGQHGSTSTASGLFGFTDGTWVEQARQALPEAEGMTREQVLELRDDPDTQEKVMGHFTEGNVRVLKDAGFDGTPAEVYTVHFAGRTGGLNVLNADKEDALSSVLSADAMEANENIKDERGKKFADWTVADFRKWTREKMGEVDDG